MTGKQKVSDEDKMKKASKDQKPDVYI